MALIDKSKSQRAKNFKATPKTSSSLASAHNTGLFRAMNFATIILLASLGTEQRISAAAGGPLTYFFTSAPISGDLGRDKKHPLVILLPMHRHKKESLSAFGEVLHRGGFAVLIADYRQQGGPYKQSWKDVETLRRWALLQNGVDEKRVYLVGASIGSSVAIDTARHNPKGIEGLILMTPGLNYLGLAVLPMLAELRPVPVLMTADYKERSALSTLRTVLKGRFPALRAIIRAGIGHGSEQFDKSPSMKDQLLITLRSWAEKNCDRVKLKKMMLDEGCKK
jgi:pimeloyl-ACP methyl ester carboxylesterase